MAPEPRVTSVEQDVGVPSQGTPSDQSGEGKSQSILSKVKDKAKVTVHKLKKKVKKGSDDTSEDISSPRSGGQSGEEPTSDALEESSSEAQRESKEVAKSTGTDEVEEEETGSEQRVSFGVDPEDDKLGPFARSAAEKDPLKATPLIATPTSYGEPHTTVEDVMPPSIIEPTSVSDLGEESSSNLGNIPEAKEEEKAAAQEVADGGPDADINEGFKETFQQKDLQAIDGLPKPRGFDVGNEDRVDSGDLGFKVNQALADQTTSRDAEGNAGEASKGGTREFSSDGSNAETTQSRGSEQNTEKLHPPGTLSRDVDTEGNKSTGTKGDEQHPPGSVAEFNDSMFSSNAIHDLKPNDPKAAEAKHAGEIGTLSRDVDTEGNKSSGTEGDERHPPGSVAEFDDSMFSSNAIHDLKPNDPKAAEAKHAGEIGTLSRDVDTEGNKSIGTKGDEQHPPGSVAEFNDSMFSSNAIHDLKPNDPRAAEAKHAGEIGTLSRDIDTEGNKSSGTEGDEQHPPGSVAEFNDSMFSSNSIHDLKPNDPNAAEAKHADEIGTFSRGIDPEANKSSSTGGDAESMHHPPAAESEMHESMFSSNIANDLKPSQKDKASSTKTNSEGGAPIGELTNPGRTDERSSTRTNSGGDAPTGELPREGESDGNTNFQDPPQHLPPQALAGDKEDSRQNDGSSAEKEGQIDHDKKPITAEEEAENYFDTVSDEVATATERSFDSDTSKDFNLEATDEYFKQRDFLTESANSRIKAAMNDEISMKTDSDNNGTEVICTLVSPLRFVVDTLTSTVGLASPYPQSS